MTKRLVLETNGMVGIFGRLEDNAIPPPTLETPIGRVQLAAIKPRYHLYKLA